MAYGSKMNYRSSGFIAGSLVAMAASYTYKTQADEANHLTFSWGSSKKGQLGVGHENSTVVEPVQVEDLEGMRLK
jgi:hypothetical protein